MKNGISLFNPEHLLSGPRASIQSPAETSTDILEGYEVSRQEFRNWADQAKHYNSATIAAKSMAGFHLRAMRVFYFGERTVGRPKRMPHAAGFPDWTTMLKDVADISPDTGERWMKIADAVEAMALKEGCDIFSICKKLPSEWTPEESERLGITVKRLTEDKTQRELLQADFLSGLGYVEPERANGSNNPNGKNGGMKTPPVSIQESVRLRQEAARLILFGTVKPGFAERGSIALFILNAVNSNGSEIEALPKKELQDFYDNDLKPFTDLILRMTKTSGR